MVRTNTRNYSENHVIQILEYISKNEPIKINQVIFKFGPNIDKNIKNAINVLYEENIIGSKESFLKTHVDFSPWDTIIYDGIADSFIGVDENKNLYLKNKSYEKYNINSPVAMEHTK